MKKFSSIYYALAIALLGVYFASAAPAPIGTVTTSPGGAPPTPIATTSTAGKVKPDGTTITVTPDGTISAGVAPPVASTTVSGTIKVGSGLSMDTDGKLNNTGVAGVASFGTPPRAGAVKPGFNDYSANMIKGLAPVAKTGAYNDLTGKPTIPAAQVNSDWTASSGVAQILNKPTVPTALSQLSQDATHRTVTDTEKATWSAQSNSVNSVNGQTDAVTLTATDVGADPLGAATSVQENLDALGASLGTAATKNMPGNVYVQATDPGGTSNDVWIDTSGSPVPAVVPTLAADNTFTGTNTVNDLIVKGPWIDARAYATLAAADAAAVAAGKLLVISSQWNTVPSSLSASAKIIPGGKLNNSGPLTINGSFEGADGCFIGAGAVTGLKEARPEWWTINAVPGTTDMSAAFTKAIAAASGSSAHVGTVIAVGRYGVASSIDGSGKNNYTIRGVPSGTPYGGAETGSAYAGTVIIAAVGWPTNTPVINMTNSKNSHVYDVGILMANGGNGYGIQIGNTAGSTTYPIHTIHGCSIYGGQVGILSRYAGLLKVESNNVSYASEQGMYMIAAGDSDFNGNFINGVNVSYTGDDLFTGAAMVFTESGGGCTVRGGKIEWNAKGIIIAKNSSRVRVNAVDFDTNRFFHIAVMSTGVGTIDFNNTITGNSFSAGGTVEDSNGIGKAAIVIGHYGTVSSILSRGAITGNTFTQNSDSITNPEDGTGPNPGPSTAAIKLLKSVTGSMYWQISGNMMNKPSLQYGIYADGFVSVRASNWSSLPNYSANGASIQNAQLEPAWSDLAFSADNFTSSAGSWTVAADDQKYIRYAVVGKMMTVTLSISTTTVAGAPTYLAVKVPGGYTAGSQADNFYSPVFVKNGGVAGIGTAMVLQNGTTIRIYKDQTFTTAFTNETDLTSVYGTVTFPIQ